MQLAQLGCRLAGFRVLGVDLGTKRIGVAVCDDGHRVASPYGTVDRVNNRPVEHDELALIMQETGAELVVVGLPISLDGTLGPAGKAVLSEVKSMRKRLSVTVETHDERFTTVEAERSQRAMKMKAKKRKQTVDQLAATVILQSWLDSTATTKENK